PNANGTAQHESERGPSAGARQLRDEFRDRGGRHADSALAGGTSDLLDPFLADPSVMASGADDLPMMLRRCQMTKWTVGCVVLCGLLLAGASVQAHHSLAGVYALGKEAKVSGEFKA